MMKKSEAQKALIELSRKLLLLKSERHKIIRSDMIDAILDSEDGEISSLAKFIREANANNHRY